MLFFGIINNKYNGDMEHDAEYRLLISGFFIPFFNIGKKSEFKERKFFTEKKIVEHLKNDRK